WQVPFEGHSDVVEVILDFVEEVFAVSKLLDGANHREHDANVTVEGGTENGSQLRPEEVEIPQAQPHAAEAEERVLFHAQVARRVGKLVGPEVEGANDDGSVVAERCQHFPVSVV